MMRVGGERHAQGSRCRSIKGYLLDLGWLFPIFGAFVIVAAGNCVNLTDGLDGLAIVPSMIAAGAFALIAYLVGNRDLRRLSRHQSRARASASSRSSARR